ncbi:MAG: IgGFc-binding protein, partial [Candidatus Kapabacteria bacterium]|nr:IgGFc-binding protein [Candidatus Kapabacteria bacterium]
GTEFWLCFQRNHEESGGDSLMLMLFLTSRWEARARVQVFGLDFDSTLRLPPRTVVPVVLPWRAELRSPGRTEYGVVYVRADTPIAVYGLNRRRQSTDTYMALPLNVLGTEYRVMSYHRLSASFVPQVAIVAVEDSTEVVLSLSTAPVDTRSVQPGRDRDRGALAYPIRIWLNRGQIYQWFAPSAGEPSDITGALVRASRPVAVFSGHVCAYVPLVVPACNHLVEQLPPVQSWGRHYYVGKLRWRSRYVLRVLAHYPGTRIFINDRPVRDLEAGEVWEQVFTENVQVTADKPILVAQFSEGYQNGDSIGDPMMLLLTPTQQFLSSYRFATPVQGSWRHFLNLIVPLSVVSSLRFNGSPIRASFERVGTSQYSVAQIEIPYGSHTVEADEPFGLYAYGFGYGPDSYDAYGNPVGQAFRDVQRQQDVLPPVAEIVQQGERVVVSIRDDRPTDQGLQEIRVLRSNNLQGTLPIVTPGMLRAEARFAPLDLQKAGYAVLALTDLAGNRSTVTLCYTYDLREERFLFVLCEGEQQECLPPIRLWFAGGYLRLANVQHAAAVPRTANLPPMDGLFGDATGWAGVGGAFVGVRLSPLWGFLARLSLEMYGGTLAAPDTVSRRVRLPDGTVTDFQEERLLSLRAPYASLGIGVTWYVFAGLYAQAELHTQARLGSAITLRRRILQPPGYVYSQTRTPMLDEPVSTFAALRPVYWSASLVAGTQYPLAHNWRLVAEIFYTHGLTDLVTTGRWRLYQLGIYLGVLYRWWW